MKATKKTPAMKVKAEMKIKTAMKGTNKNAIVPKAMKAPAAGKGKNNLRRLYFIML